MRSKEDAHDYRYFPDPDLPPLVIAPEWIEAVRAQMPELPREIAVRLIRDYGLTPYAASQLLAERSLFDFFEASCLRRTDIDFPAEAWVNEEVVRVCANLVIGEVAKKLNEDAGPRWEFWVSPQTVGRIAMRIKDGSISVKVGRDLLGSIWNEDRAKGSCRWHDEVDVLIESRGLKQMSDSGELERLIDEVLAANPKSVEEYRAGRDKAFNALVGQAMKATKGKGNPTQVNELLKKKLG